MLGTVQQSVTLLRARGPYLLQSCRHRYRSVGPPLHGEAHDWKSEPLGSKLPPRCRMGSAFFRGSPHVLEGCR